MDHAILQRAPNRAAVTGSLPASYQPAPTAVVTLTVQQFDGDGSKNYSATVNADRTFKLLLEQRPAGGNYTMTIQCTAGCTTPTAAPASATVVDITFGDVYLCTGQSPWIFITSIHAMIRSCLTV